MRLDKQEREWVDRLIGTHLKRELTMGLRDCLQSLDDNTQRHEVVEYLKKYTVFMNEVQSLEPRCLLAYWQGTFAVFNFLRRCGELHKKGEAFRPEVKSELYRVLDALMNEYEHDKH